MALIDTHIPSKGERCFALISLFHTPWYIFFSEHRKSKDITQESENLDYHNIILGFGKLKTKESSMFWLVVLKKMIHTQCESQVHYLHPFITASNFLSSNSK